MNLATIFTRAPQTLNAALVHVEVNLASGLPNVTLVGLPEKAVKESKDRVRAAILNSDLILPAKYITISLAPAELPKDGARYDLPIALGILAASGQLGDFDFGRYEWHGELALSGELRPINGVLPSALAARESGRFIVVPPENLAEALLIMPHALAVKSLAHFIEIAHGEADWIRQSSMPIERFSYPDFADVVGQHQAKRALLIAAAGGHHVLMSGSPGTGKSMLAQRLAGILPPMSIQEAIESASIQSVSHQGFDARHWQQRPYRAPHHTSSGTALAGGGTIPKPGDISLAHNGVLFLDELPEFGRKVLEILREPLENGSVSISRAAQKVDFPANFQLVAAMNPCPCGYHGDPVHQCIDTPERIKRYRGKISGPLLDRIDIHLTIPHLTPRQLREQSQDGMNSDYLRAQATAARQIQLERQGVMNAKLTGQKLIDCINVENSVIELLDNAAEHLHLSMRAYHRILRVARTIADLSQSPQIQKQHAAEALTYRPNI